MQMLDSKVLSLMTFWVMEVSERRERADSGIMPIPRPAFTILAVVLASSFIQKTLGVRAFSWQMFLTICSQRR